MGYEITLQLLAPEQYSGHYVVERLEQKLPKVLPTCTLWKPIALLNVDRVTSVRKRQDFEKRPPRQRAATYFIDAVWVPFERETKVRGPACYAPPFAITPRSKDPGHPAPTWSEAFAYGEAKGDVFIEPFEHWYTGAKSPSRDVMDQHNAALHANLRHAEDSDPVFSFPLTWFPCRDVVTWIEQSEGSYGRTQLAKEDALTVAFFESWRSMLLCFANTPVKCLFVFEDSEIPTTIG